MKQPLCAIAPARLLGRVVSVWKVELLINLVNYNRDIPPHRSPVFLAP
jgi:hypothetical protein